MALKPGSSTRPRALARLPAVLRLLALVVVSVAGLGGPGLLAGQDVDRDWVPVPAVVNAPLSGGFSVVEGHRSVDTVVLHYASALGWFDAGLQAALDDEAQALADSLGLSPGTLEDHKYDWRLVREVFRVLRVSAHYLIARDGTVVRLVDEDDRAWHAGQSRMPVDGRTGVNDFSIGIELVSSHPDDDPTVRTPEEAYTDAQYAALAWLLSEVCTRQPIEWVVGHDEIAPGRRSDPGPLFRWDGVRTDTMAPTAPPCTAF